MQLEACGLKPEACSLHRPADLVRALGGSQDPLDKALAAVAVIEIFQLVVTILARAIFEVYVRRATLPSTSHQLPSARPPSPL